MSDYIYGSSLRAAKSKANYLFEGDFRRRPNQNLSGASRSLARGELLQQAAEQRQNREDIRKREQASVKVQSVWRGYNCRKTAGRLMREAFDDAIGRNGINNQADQPIKGGNFDNIIREFILYYHSKIDEQRLDALIDLILEQPDVFLRLKAQDKNVWLHRLTKLLIMNLTLLDRHLVPAESKHLSFLEVFTRKNHVLDGAQIVIVWRVLVQHKIYITLRKLADYHNRTVLNSEQNNCNKFSQILIELIRRSLDVVDSGAVDVETLPIYPFFNEFLKGPIDSTLDVFYFSELLKLKPDGLEAKYVLPAFANSLSTSNMVSRNPSAPTYFSASSSWIPECTNAIWLCYAFVTTIHTQVNQLGDSDKTDYINILSSLLGPAEYITNISLMQIANTEDTFQNDEFVEEVDSSSKTNHIFQYYTELNIVITRLVNLINDPSHIDGLKSIIFNSDLQPKVQAAIIRVCNLMLAHEPLAIFNCRLLYTVAFSKEFSRSLWKGIVSSTSASLYGSNSPIYLQLIRGMNIGHESWEKILPQLRLFCSLYSYLLPTLDDEEFYTDDDKSIFNDDDFLYRLSEKRQHELNDRQTQPKNSKGSNTFFIDKELISISAVLRDICVGFIEILYQDNRHSYPKSASKFDQSLQDERSKLLQFETKLCFKAIVRLICQLHARDSRKQFCPRGHWICPSVAIPANKAIDFQLVTSQQGRLLSLMTKDDPNHERLASASNEIKTVLILQEIPFVVSFHDRVQILHQLLRKEKLIHQSEGYHFGLPGTAIQVQIRRNYIYEDAFEKLSVENEPNMKMPLKVSLINAAGVDEAGIDGGGLSKEFLSELLRAGFDPMRGFFKSTRDQLLYPNPSANVLFSTLAEGYEIHYQFLGRMLGKAIFEKIMVELPLAGFFLAKLLARRHSSDVDLHNLASLDPVLYKNLVYLKNYKGDVADLNLDFTISNNELDEHEVVELKPGGSKIPVTSENKIEYVHLVADYRLNKQIRAQCAAFKRGLSQLIDLDWLRMFDPRELQILISGAPTVIDIEDWRRNTIYGNGFTDDCGAINIFWRVASQLDENQKRKLLKFATSCSLPPLLGFKDLVPQFTIAPSEETRLPTASTCMNLLKLPDCEDENTMRSKILYAIESNSGFELS